MKPDPWHEKGMVFLTNKIITGILGRGKDQVTDEHWSLTAIAHATYPGFSL